MYPNKSVGEEGAGTWVGQINVGECLIVVVSLSS